MVISMSEGSDGDLHYQDFSRPMGVGTTARLVRTDRGRELQGIMEVTEYEPVTSSTVVSRFGPFRLRARTTFAPVAPMVKSLRVIKEQVEATASPMT
jgi:hypothetical protein